MKVKILKGLFCALFFVTFAKGERAPNIIFMLTDDQAYRTLGITGNGQVKTPHIDQLGRQGVVFDNHYNVSPMCMPSRANVMSGMYEYKNGCNFKHGSMRPEVWETSYPVLLKNEGYRVANVGKFGFRVSDLKNTYQPGADGAGVRDTFDLYLTKGGQCNYTTARNEGMNRYAKDNPHLTQALAAATIDFMRESTQIAAPFCVTVGFKAPHKPLLPDPQFDDVYKDTVWEKPLNYGREAGLHLSEQSRQGRQYLRYWSEAYDSDEKYQHTMRAYHQLLHGVDVAVGKILSEVQALGIADNTVIIYSSDNGYLHGAYGMGGKALPYEESARAPLIIYDPRSQQSRSIRRTRSLSGNVDIGATIVDLAGLAVPHSYDGRSLLPVLTNEMTQVRDTLPIMQVFGLEATRCLSVIKDEYKYIYWFYEGNGMKATEELFHLAGDSVEMENLASSAEYKPKLEEMREAYDAQVKAWVERSIDFNGYAEYGVLFDRHIPWEQKASIIPIKNSKLKTIRPRKRATK